MEAKLDGFRMYKIKNRGDLISSIDGVTRNYVAPVYVCGLPGDIAALNKELALMTTEFEHLVKVDGKGRNH